MPKKFIPMYDIKIRGGEHIIEWRYGANPTVHAVSPSGVPLVLRQRAHVTPNASDGVRQVTQDGARAGGAGNRLSVLPPIKDTGRRREEGFNLSELEDISLKNEVLRKGRDMNERNLQSLLANLRSQDRDRDGVLPSETIKTILKKFQFQLSDDGMKSLCKKFGESGTLVSVVRYEEMFNYITRSRIEALRAPPPVQRPGGVVGNEQQQSQQQQMQTQSHQQNMQPRKINQRNRVMFDSKDEAKLIEDLRIQISNMPVNMADLRRTMYDLDRDRNEFLSPKQVEIALAKCGFHFTPDVRARLLLATDRTGAGMHKIETIMNYLTRIKPEQYDNTVLNIGNNHQPREARVGQLPTDPRQPWDTVHHDQSAGGQPEYLPDEGFIEQENQPEGPMTYGPLPPEDVLAPDADVGFDAEKWSNDYQFLAQAVYNADQDQSGYMPAEEVHQVIATYNLVYNLNISGESLNAALNAANDPNYGEVNLEYFIATLQDLHFREIGVY